MTYRRFMFWVYVCVYTLGLMALYFDLLVWRP